MGKSTPAIIVDCSLNKSDFYDQKRKRARERRETGPALVPNTFITPSSHRRKLVQVLDGSVQLIVLAVPERLW